MLGFSFILMHYIGMYSMKCVHMEFNFIMVSISCLIAILSAIIGTIIMFLITHNILRRVQPFILTIAVCGMHYTGMLKIKYTESSCPDGWLLHTDVLPFLASGFASTA